MNGRRIQRAACERRRQGISTIATMSQSLLPFPWLDIILILALVALNGVLAMSELAIVSAREARLKAMAKSGQRRRQCALELAADPGRFLSTVQTGITLIGILAGAFSGASLGEPGRRNGWQLLGVTRRTRRDDRLRAGDRAHDLASAGHRRAGPQAVRAALARADRGGHGAADAAGCRRRPRRSSGCSTGPARSMFRLIGLTANRRIIVTAEELHLVVAEAQTAGVLEESERAIISGIVRLADRPVREVMTPRTEIDWIDVGCEPRRDSRRARRDAAQPAAGGRRIGRQNRRRGPDARPADGAARRASRRPRELVTSAPVIPDLMDAMDALAVLRSAECRWRWSMTNMATSTES